MAIHKAVVYQNTSVINDEVLCHRFGLLPVKADPSLFEDWKEGDRLTEKNSIRFLLNVKNICKNDESANAGSKKN